jgi:hypothetical protein
MKLKLRGNKGGFKFVDGEVWCRQELCLTTAT